MSDAMVEIVLHMAVVLALALLAAAATRSRIATGWLAIALGLMLLRDALVLRGYGLVPDLFPASDWNWTGKLLAAAGLLAVAALPAFGLRRCGVTVRQAHGSWVAWGVFAAVAVLIVVLAVLGRDGADDFDTIAFQWTMPGIEEELFYRGVLLLALQRALDGRDAPTRLAGIGWGGALASVAFGLGHALSWRDGAASFDVAAFVLTGGPALLIAWFRARTGSLVLPVLSHNTANGVSTLF